MKRINITHITTATKVDAELHFNHPENELSDYEIVEIIPINSEGAQIAQEEQRSVVQIGHSIDGIAQYKAFIRKEL